jgi:anthranilate phosphoribosyltransferase
MNVELDIVLDSELRSALEGDCDFNLLRAILMKYREKGFSSESVYEFLGTMRSGVAESTDDRILELMDIVSGFCSPGMRVW